LKIVIKLGGYIFPSNLDAHVILKYAQLFRKLSREGHKLVIITGGGEEARKYITIARELRGSEVICDLIGIEISRINALLLITALGNDAYPEPPKTIMDLKQAFEIGKIVVLGGLLPGQSTNAVGALSAEAIGADVFINATDVDGVYTEDPQKSIVAKKLDSISTKKLLKLVLTKNLSAGSYELFDPVAIKIVERSKIPSWIIDGRKLENIRQVIKGDTCGTYIQPS
jgi:uridylate kinase